MVRYEQYPCGETKGVCWWGGGCGGDSSLGSTPVGTPPCKIRHHRSFP